MKTERHSAPHNDGFYCSTETLHDAISLSLDARKVSPHSRGLLEWYQQNSGISSRSWSHSPHFMFSCSSFQWSQLLLATCSLQRQRRHRTSNLNAKHCSHVCRFLQRLHLFFCFSSFPVFLARRWRTLGVLGLHGVGFLGTYQIGLLRIFSLLWKTTETAA